MDDYKKRTLKASLAIHSLNASLQKAANGEEVDLLIKETLEMITTEIQMAAKVRKKDLALLSMNFYQSKISQSIDAVLRPAHVMPQISSPLEGMFRQIDEFNAQIHEMTSFNSFQKSKLGKDG